MTITTLAPQPYPPGSFPTGDSKVGRLQTLAAKSASGEELSSHEQKEIAQQFEAMMLKQMLKQSMQSLLSGNMFGSGPAAEHYQDMFTENMAEVMATTGNGIGVAQEILLAIEQETHDSKTVVEHRFIPLNQQVSQKFAEINPVQEMPLLNNAPAYRPVPNKLYAPQWLPLNTKAITEGN